MTTINDKFRQQLIPDGVEAVLEHVNNAQRFATARVFDQVMSQLARGRSIDASIAQRDPEFYGQRGVDPPIAPYAFCLTPGGAYLRQGSANNKVQIAPGTLFQRITNTRTVTASGAGGPGAGGPNSDGLEESFLAFTFDGTTELTIANGDPSNPRVDLIQMSLSFVEGDLLAEVYDSATPPAVNLVAQSVDTTRRVQCVLSIKQGAPAAAPTYPDPDPGFVAVGGVVVGTNYVGAAALKFYDAAGAVAVLHDQRMPLCVRAHSIEPRNYGVIAADFTDDTFHETRQNTFGGDVIARIPCPGGLAGRIVAMALTSNMDGVASGRAKVARKKWDNVASISHDGSIDCSQLGDTGGTGHFLRRTLELDGGVVSHTPSAGPTIHASATYGIHVPVWTSGLRIPYEEIRQSNVDATFEVTYNGVSLELNVDDTKKLGPFTWYIAEGL